MRFSQRHGLSPIKTLIQTDSIDVDLKNGLWNALDLFYWNSVKASSGVYSGYFLSELAYRKIQALCQLLWLEFFKKPIDTLSGDWLKVRAELRGFFFKCPWHEAYDFIEFIAQAYDDAKSNSEFVEFCNFVLEREVSAYRFVGGKITRIVAPEEISAIEDALQSPLDPIKTHITRSLELLADRKNPDYRNSIKEAISAVEAVVKLVTGDENGTLGKLLVNLNLHPALQQAFGKLYGYTSDAEGIRHALLDQDKLRFEDAKFMLVASSAFVNYVIATNKVSS